MALKGNLCVKALKKYLCIRSGSVCVVEDFEQVFVKVKQRKFKTSFTNKFFKS